MSRKFEKPPGIDQIDPVTGRRRCGALRNNGEPCKQRPLPNGRCKFHGGSVVSGVESPFIKSGRYSKHLPARLVERYNRSEDDPELLGLRADVALLQTRIMELTERLHTGESGSLWRDLQQTWTEYNKALAEQLVAQSDKAKAKADDQVRASLATLGELIRAGATDEQAWNELARAVKDKTRVAQAEHKRQADLNQVITAERALVFAMTLLDVVLKYTPEQERRQIIAREIYGLMNAPVSHRHEQEEELKTTQ